MSVEEDDYDEEDGPGQDKDGMGHYSDGLVPREGSSDTDESIRVYRDSASRKDSALNTLASPEACLSPEVIGSILDLFPFPDVQIMRASPTPTGMARLDHWIPRSEGQGQPSEILILLNIELHSVLIHANTHNQCIIFYDSMQTANDEQADKREEAVGQVCKALGPGWHSKWNDQVSSKHSGSIKASAILTIFFETSQQTSGHECGTYLFLSCLFRLASQEVPNTLAASLKLHRTVLSWLSMNQSVSETELDMVLGVPDSLPPLDDVATDVFVDESAWNSRVHFSKKLRAFKETNVDAQCKELRGLYNGLLLRYKTVASSLPMSSIDQANIDEVQRRIIQCEEMGSKFQMEMGGQIKQLQGRIDSIKEEAVKRHLGRVERVLEMISAMESRAREVTKRKEQELRDLVSYLEREIERRKRLCGLLLEGVTCYN